MFWAFGRGIFQGPRVLRWGRNHRLFDLEVLGWQVMPLLPIEIADLGIKPSGKASGSTGAMTSRDTSSLAFPPEGKGRGMGWGRGRRPFFLAGAPALLAPGAGRGLLREEGGGQSPRISGRANGEP